MKLATHIIVRLVEPMDFPTADRLAESIEEGLLGGDDAYPAYDDGFGHLVRLTEDES